MGMDASVPAIHRSEQGLTRGFREVEKTSPWRCVGIHVSVLLPLALRNDEPGCGGGP